MLSWSSSDGGNGTLLCRVVYFIHLLFKGTFTDSIIQQRNILNEQNECGIRLQLNKLIKNLQRKERKNTNKVLNYV